MTKFTLNQVRSLFLEFHKSKGHTITPSAPLVPKEDPTVLFNTAGMQPMIQYLTGQSNYPDGIKRIANSQICLRTDDIEEVGDNRHCTCFEMLGNWSLNDYFKDQIIPWSMEFLTSENWVGMDKNRIFVTVYKGNIKEKIDEDTVAINLWKNEYKKLDIEAKDTLEFDFKGFKKKYPDLDKVNHETTKYIVLDFDGVIADSLNSVVEFIYLHKDEFGFSEKTKTDINHYISNHFSTAKPATKEGSEFSLSILATKYLKWIDENNIQIKLFKEFLKTLSTLENTRFAIVTDNSIDIVNKTLKDNKFENIGLKIDIILSKEDGNNKVKKLQKVLDKWGIRANECIYITDTVRDKLELENFVGKENIYAKFGGFSSDQSILNNFDYQNILFKSEDIFNLYKPKLNTKFTLEEIINLNLISRIRKMSGKDNWWGLPYKGPCGPCSEMYYLLNHNPINFEQSIFPNCTITQVEEFIENQIVEIGNNVFMMYEGEKDFIKEPIHTKNLGINNVDTGLGLERFVVAINGYSSLYEIDIYQSTLSVIDKYSK